MLRQKKEFRKNLLHRNIPFKPGSDHGLKPGVGTLEWFRFQYNEYIMDLALVSALKNCLENCLEK